jgi:2-phospho-L-lactate guanylyltransferase
MRVVVPFDERRPKTRLSDTLGADERSAFARAMLGDVLAAVGAAVREDASVNRLTVLSTAPLPPLPSLVEGPGDRGSDDVPSTGDESGLDCEVVVDERSLTPAVNDVLAETAGPTAVVMADLALATPSAVTRLLAPDGGDGDDDDDGAGTGGDGEGSRRTVTLVSGRGGGTNALVARHPDFRVDYHGLSFRDHRRTVRSVGAALRRVDSYRLSTDVDERADLPEVLLHGGPRSRGWLRRAGVRLTVDEGRVSVTREDD